MPAPPLLLVPPLTRAAEVSEAPTDGRRVSLEELYDRHADYVHHTLRRLGVPPAGLSDALQEVFIVVHRRLPELSLSGSAKPWLFVLAMGIARNHRRTLRRKSPERGGSERAPVEPDDLGGRADEPFERTAHAERIELFYRLLGNLDEDKRAVFVLAELEQLTVPEIATTLSLNVNTAYARLRAARQKFEHALARFRAQEREGVR